MKNIGFLTVFCFFSSFFYSQEKKHLIVKDKETGQLLDGVNIDFKDKKTGIVIKAVSDIKGVVFANLVANNKYVIVSEKIGYDPIMEDFTPKNNDITRDIKIRKTAEGVMIRLENVVYEYDKSNLSRSGKNQLDTLYRFLKENKKFLIELNSHTDCRGSEQYNLKLSKLRSLSCNNYLRSKGLKFSRIVMNNFGESKLINHCSDDVECPEDLHQVNRRTEFILLFPK
jgi:peptidoglycan-associated lipoprotein